METQFHSLTAIDMKAMINKVVKVDYESHSQEGIVYTIDPMSGMIALMVKDNGSNRFNMHLIFKSHIKSVQVVGPSDYVFNDLFDKRKPGMTADEKVKRRDKLVSWLQSRMIPVTKDGEVIKVKDVLIYPPYQLDDCVSKSVMTLEKIKQNIIDMDRTD